MAYQQYLSPNVTSAGVNVPRRFNKLLKLVGSVEFYKTKFINSYREWDVTSGTVVEEFLEIEKSLKTNSDVANCVKVGGDVGKILGCCAALIGELFIKDEKTADTLKDIGTGMTAIGMAVSEGSTMINNFLTKELCEKAKNTLGKLIKTTKELEGDRKEYFKLLDGYVKLLEELEDRELQMLYNYLNENNLGNIHSDVSLESRVQEHLPPNLLEMEHLKLDEDAVNVSIIQFNYVPKIAKCIKNNPLMKDFLDWKYESLPILNGENVANTVLTVANLQSNTAIFDLIGTFCSSQSVDLFRGMSSFNRHTLGTVFCLANEICNLVETCSSFEEKSVQSKEIRRVADEMKIYRKEVRNLLRRCLDWDCFKRDWYLWKERNRLPELNSSLQTYKPTYQKKYY